MQVISAKASFALSVALFLVVMCAVEDSCANRHPTLVIVQCGGDDGLTMKLRDSLENAFRSSSLFLLTAERRPGTLVVTIPSNVGWKQVDGRVQVLYNVEFASVDNQQVGTSGGSCWDDDLGGCAAKIVKDAQTAALKLQSTQ